MNERRKVLMTASAVALATGFAQAPVFAQDAPLRIGFSMAKTGLYAKAAPSQLNAYELWREEVNAAGGLDVGGKRRKVEFVQFDDQSNGAQAAKIYEKLITQDKVDLLLAPWGTSIHLAIAPVIERYKFPMIGNTAASVKLRELKAKNIWFVTAAFPDRIATELAAVLKQDGVKSVALLTNVLPFSKEIKQFLEPALKSAGIEIKVNEEYPPDIKDMTAVLAKVKQAKVGSVLSLSYPDDSVLYVRQAKEQGIDAPFQLVAIGPAMDFFPKVLGDSVNNIVTIGHWAPGRNDQAKAFYAAYQKRWNEKPDFLDSIESYVSCQILQQAVAKAGLDKDKLRDTISKGTFQTINGPIAFDGVENKTTKTGFLQMQDGEQQMIWPADGATGKFRPKKTW